MVHVLSQVEFSENDCQKFVNSGFLIEYKGRFSFDKFSHPEKYKAIIANGIDAITADDMDNMSSLEIICVIGVGYERIDLNGAQKRGVSITHGPGTNTNTVVEHAIALMLALTRRICILDSRVRSGEWYALRKSLPTLNEKKLGVVGLGNIGSAIASRCHLAFNMSIGFHNRSKISGSRYRHFSSPAELAMWADYLIVCTPGGASGCNIIDNVVLDNLGPEGYLINIGRGCAVNNEALLECLRNNRIKGAALDVVDGEPDIPSAFFSLQNILLTPHVAAFSPEAIDAMLTLVLKNLVCYFSQGKLISPVAKL